MARKRDPGGYSLSPKVSDAVAGRIRKALQAKGMKQAALSAATKIPPSHLSDLLRTTGVRHRNFQGWQVQAIAKALGVSEAELVGALALDAIQSLNETQHALSKDALLLQREIERPLTVLPAMLSVFAYLSPEAQASLAKYAADNATTLTVFDLCLLAGYGVQTPGVNVDEAYWAKTFTYLHSVYERFFQTVEKGRQSRDQLERLLEFAASDTLIQAAAKMDSKK
jgi:transcriptional regulator with XRE-family HTH domain